MPFNPDEFLAKHQAAQADAPSTGGGFDPDQFLQTNGVQTLPNKGQIQDGASAAKAFLNTADSYTVSGLRAAQSGAGTPMGTTASAGLEAAAGTAQSILSGSNNFGDEGRSDLWNNFKQNFARAKETQDQQISQAQEANPKTFGTVNFLSNIPRLVAETELIGLGPTGALESGMASAAKGNDLSTIATDAGKGALTNLVLGKAFDLVGSGLEGINASKSAIDTVGKLFGDDAQAAASKALSNTVFQKSINNVASLGSLAIGGGAVNVLLQNPKNWDQAVSQFKQGSELGLALGIAKTAGGGLFKWGGNIIAKAEAKQVAQEVENQSNNLNSLETDLTLKNQDLETAKLGKTNIENEATRLQNVKDASESAKNRYGAVLNEEPNISARITSVPQTIDQTLASTADNFGTQIKSRIQGFDPTTKVDVYSDLSKAYNKIEGVKTFTSDASNAKDQARSAIQSFENATNPTRAQFDPFTNRTSGQNTSTINPQDLWTAKQQIQDLLYNKNFLEASRGTGLRQVMTDFERSVREKLNSLDPSGELAKYNDAYSNMLNARTSFQENGDLGFLLKKAKSPNDPKVIEATQELEKHFMDSDSLKQQGIKFGGLKPETASDPIIGNQIKAVKGAVDAQASSAINDYALLLQAKKEMPRVQAELERTTSKLEAIQNQQRLADIDIAKSSQAVNKTASKITTTKQGLEALKTPDYNIPGTGGLKSKLQFLRSVGSTAIEDPALKTIGTGLGYTKQALQRVTAPQTSTRITTTVK